MQQNNIRSRFSPVSIDGTGPLPRTARGNRYLLTVVDRFTKWSEAIAVPDATAKTITKAPRLGFFISVLQLAVPRSNIELYFRLRT